MRVTIKDTQESTEKRETNKLFLLSQPHLSALPRGVNASTCAYTKEKTLALAARLRTFHRHSSAAGRESQGLPRNEATTRRPGHGSARSRLRASTPEVNSSRGGEASSENRRDPRRSRGPTHRHDASRGSQVSPNPSPPLGQCPRNPAKRHCTSVPSLSPTLPSTPPLPSPVFVHPGNLEVVAAIFRRGDIRPCCEAQSPTAARHPGHGPFCRLPRNVSRSHRLSPTAYVAGDNFWVRDTEDAVWSTSRIRPGFLHPTTYPVLFVNFLLLLFAAS